MKNQDLKNYFNKIKEGTDGNNSSDTDIIDYKNGESIHISDIEKEYYNYLDLVDNIDIYIESNDLDDVFDADEIKKHFADTVDEDLFLFNQACLKDFVDYMVTKINKLNK